MFAIDIMYHLFAFVFMPRLTNFMMAEGTRPALPMVVGSYIVVTLNGAQIMSHFQHALTDAMWMVVCSGVTLCGTLMMYFLYDNKICVFIGAMLIALCQGMVKAPLLNMKKDNYPSELRGYILGCMRVPSSILACVIIFYGHQYSALVYLMITAVVILICHILCIARWFTTREPSEDVM